MDDFTPDDLKQLLSIYSNFEYIKLSVHKLEILEDIIKNLSNKVSDKSFKSFLLDFLSNIEKEKNQYLIQLSIIDKKDGSFEYPMILKDINGESQEDLFNNFVEMYDFYVKITNIMFDSLCNLEGSDPNIKNINKNTIDSSIINKINDINIEEPAVEEPVVEEPVVTEPVVEELVEVKDEEVQVVEPVVEVKDEEVQVLEPVVVEDVSGDVVEPVVVEDVSRTDIQMDYLEEKKELVAVNTENNIQSIINMEHTPENMQTLQANFNTNLEKFKELSSTLESKKSEIETCKKSLEDFKAKGMNVDSALAPLDAQFNEVNEKLNKNISTLNTICKTFDSLLESMK